MSHLKPIPLLCAALLWGCAPAQKGKGDPQPVTEAAPTTHPAPDEEALAATRPVDSNPPDASAQAPAPSAPHPQPASSARPAPSRWVVEPADPPIALKQQVNLTIFRYTVPLGTVSRGEDFWKRVDERSVDPATYEILYKNGLRVGRAALADITHFMAILDRGEAALEPAIFAAANPKGDPIPLPMKRSLQDAVLYDFDAKNTLTIRSYEDCDLFLNMAFHPAPRKPGEVRISLTPAIRSQRRRIVPVGDNETRDFELRQDEKLFHLNLRTDVPLDRFLVLAPSPEGRWRMSLGHALLVKEAGAEKTEEVLIIVPQALRVRPDKPPGSGQPHTPAVDPNQ